MNVAKYLDASGNSSRLNRIRPYAPDLQQDAGQDHRPGRRRLGVRVGQPGVQREQRHLHRERDEEREEQPPRGLGASAAATAVSCRTSNVPWPSGPADFENRNRIPTSRNAEPAIVKRKNFIAAYTRRSPPQPPMIRYIGTRSASKNTKNSSRSSERNVPMTRGLEHEHRDHVRADVLRDLPGREDRERHQERREQHHPQADAVDADQVLQADASPTSACSTSWYPGVRAVEPTEHRRATR